MSHPAAHRFHATLAHPTQRVWNTVPLPRKADIMYPIFISSDPDALSPIPSLPEQNHVGVNRLEEVIVPLVSKGLRSVILFGHPEDHTKTEDGSHAFRDDTPIVQGIKALRKLFPNVGSALGAPSPLLIAADVCLCAYTKDGHCGVSNKDGTQMDNDATLTQLEKAAVAYARAGADLVAPSDMMDCRVAGILGALRKAGFGDHVGVMSYSAKYCSAFYGPFRDAAGSSPTAGGRHGYQLPVGARDLGVRAAIRDAKEGACSVMVKPGTPYLDVVARIADNSEIMVPVSVYQVSGEYAMLWHSAEAGVMELKEAVLETMSGFTRAGATIILTYYAPRLMDWLPY